jgi:hypothetical protein
MNNLRMMDLLLSLSVTNIYIYIYAASEQSEVSAEKVFSHISKVGAVKRLLIIIISSRGKKY